MEKDVGHGGLSRRRFLQGAAAAAGATIVGPTLWSRPGWAQAAPPGSPRLTFGADPTTEMTISWSTPDAVTNPRLSYGPDASLGSTADAATHTVTALPKPVKTNYHHVRLTGLQPATTYQYRLSHSGGESDVFTFTTAPPTPEPFTFTAFGDQGVNSGGRLVTAGVAGIAPAFNLVAGDICYADGLGTGLVVDLAEFDANVWDDWFAQTAGAMRMSPWMTALGNHDMEPITLTGTQLGYRGHDARLALPEGGPGRYVYSFRYGNVGVLALDANDVSVEIPTMQGYTGGSQTRWLDDTLAALRADPTIDFLVAAFHHCAYCTAESHGSDGGVRDKWVPLFDKHGVDLVINGHNHAYERTTPIRSNTVTAESPAGTVIRSDQLGTTYVCAGAGGKSGYTFGQPYVSTGFGGKLAGQTEPEAAPWSVAASRYTDNSFIKVDVTPPDADGYTSMAITTLGAAGQVVDSVTLVRQRVAAPPPAAAEPAVAPDAAVLAATEPAARPGLPRTGGPNLVVPAAIAATAAVGTAALRRRAAAPATDAES